MAGIILPVELNAVDERGNLVAPVYIPMDFGVYAPPEWASLDIGTRRRWAYTVRSSTTQSIILGGVRYRKDGLVVYPVGQDRARIILWNEFHEIVTCDFFDV